MARYHATFPPTSHSSTSLFSWFLAFVGPRLGSSSTAKRQREREKERKRERERTNEQTRRRKKKKKKKEEKRRSKVEKKHESQLRFSLDHLIAAHYCTQDVPVRQKVCPGGVPSRMPGAGHVRRLVNAIHYPEESNGKKVTDDRLLVNLVMAQALTIIIG